MTNRRLSPWAIISAICGLASAIAFFVPAAVVIASISLAAGAVALRAIRKHDHPGRGVAYFGIAASLAMSTAAIAWHVARFRSEAPEGCVRLNFSSLTNDNQHALVSFSGQRICLKGYAYPTRFPVGTFVFTSDEARTLESMIIVQLPAGETWSWRPEALAVSGTLVENPARATDPIQPRFILTHSIIRPSRTPLQLANRVRNSGC